MGQPKDLLWKSEPRTLLKHHLYRQYLHCWMAKICQTFDHAAIVDAFAGPGEYLDGADGSSVVIAKAFAEHSRHAQFNCLALLCLEKRKERRDHLEKVMGRTCWPEKLKRFVLNPGEAVDRFPKIDEFAHRGDPRRPTLWILDPFDISSVPFTLVRQCLARPRDEVLITWFADEIYRFRTDRTKHGALDRHYGHEGWRTALGVEGEVCQRKCTR